ncbi:hypothetical protein [Romboutsia sp.]|uniref:hypothetical protein n=1 Tax=Romboutsia sp. TaxID=1965302 RepID=UPI003F2BC232
MLFNEQKVHKPGYEKGSLEEKGINFINSQRGNTYLTDAIKFTIYTRIIQRGGIESNQFDKCCNELLEICQNTYIKALENKEAHIHQKNSLSTEDIEYLSNIQDFKNLCKSINYNFDIISSADDEETEFDTDKLGQGYIADLIDLDLTLNEMNIDRQLFHDKVENLANSIKHLGEEIKKYAKTMFGYSIYNGSNIAITSLLLGSEYIIEMGEFIYNSIVDTDNNIKPLRDYKIEMLYGEGYFPFDDIDNTCEFKIIY